MSDAYTSGLSQADVLALISSTSTTSFVGNGAAMTVAQLMANYPAAATYQGLYARVMDLYGSVDDIMRCRYDGANYRWVPQREAFSGNVTSTGGTINIIPLVTPPTIRTAGTLAGNLTFAPSLINAYIGQRQRVVIANTLGLFTASVTNILGSNITLLGGSSKTIEFGPSGWFSAD